jgi:hypothetical protein
MLCVCFAFRVGFLSGEVLQGACVCLSGVGVNVSAYTLVKYVYTPVYMPHALHSEQRLFRCCRHLQRHFWSLEHRSTPCGSSTCSRIASKLWNCYLRWRSMYVSYNADFRCFACALRIEWGKCLELISCVRSQYHTLCSRRC